MFGSGDQGFGALYSLSKMMRSINEMKAPMNQFSAVLSLKDQIKSIESFTKQSSLMERITSATMPADKIGRYLQGTYEFKPWDNMLGIKNMLGGTTRNMSAIADISKTWTDEFNATLSISRLVQERNLNALANVRGSIIDSDFNKALFKAYSLFETFSKFNTEEPAWKRVKPGNSPKFDKLFLLDKEDVAFGTKVLSQAIANIENASSSGTFSIAEQLELIKPLKERRDAETDRSFLGFTRREFYQLTISQIISLLLSVITALIMSADQEAKDNVQHQEILDEIAALHDDHEQIKSDVELIKGEVFGDALRICIKSSFIREQPNTQSKILVRVNVDDVVIAPFDSSRANTKWLRVYLLDDENCEVSGWALRARFRTE